MIYTETPVILASKSPRRQMLFREVGFPLEIVEIDVDESFPDTLHREEVALYLARRKADAFTGDFSGNVLVTADTIVCLEDEVINKPASETEAFEMLSKLSGKIHTVFTGVSMRNEQKSFTFFERSDVYFKELRPEEIEYYIRHYRPLDKAGAYGVQEWIGYIGVEKISGCFYNIMGFPMPRFCSELAEFIGNKND